MHKTKTKLKFTKSNRSDSWVGFVSINTKNGCVKGVREDAKEPKMVCVVAHHLAPLIEPGVLYDVELTPMKNRKSGYIVDAATPHEFEARIESTVVKGAIYTVDVKFGNKVIHYNPMDGRLESVRTIDGVIKVLEGRKDIKNPIGVIAEFIKTANIVLTHYQNDGFYVPKIRKVS